MALPMVYRAWGARMSSWSASARYSPVCTFLRTLITAGLLPINPKKPYDAGTITETCDYEGQIVSVNVKQDDTVENGMLLYVVDTGEGKAAITEAKNAIDSENESYAQKIADYDKQTSATTEGAGKRNLAARDPYISPSMIQAELSCASLPSASGDEVSRTLPAGSSTAAAPKFVTCPTGIRPL